MSAPDPLDDRAWCARCGEGIHRNQNPRQFSRRPWLHSNGGGHDPEPVSDQPPIEVVRAYRHEQALNLLWSQYAEASNRQGPFGESGSVYDERIALQRARAAEIRVRIEAAIHDEPVYYAR